MTIRLHVACDDATVRRVLRHLVDEDPRIAIAGADGPDPVSVANAPAEHDAAPGSGAVEWRLAPDALAAVRRLLDEHPDAKIVVVPLLPAHPAPPDAGRPGAPLPSGASDRPALVLTERELQVLRLIADGLSSKEIARRLGIASRTVDVHRTHVKRKLRVQTIGDLVRAGIRAGLVTP